jgi:hypothetical protein
MRATCYFTRIPKTECKHRPLATIAGVVYRELRAGDTTTMARAKTITKSSKKAQSSEKRTYFKQADFPHAPLQQAQKIASAIIDNFGGDSGSPPDIALAIGISPTSSAWSQLTGAAKPTA